MYDNARRKDGSNSKVNNPICYKNCNHVENYIQNKVALRWCIHQNINAMYPTELCTQSIMQYTSIITQKIRGIDPHNRRATFSAVINLFGTQSASSDSVMYINGTWSYFGT